MNPEKSTNNKPNESLGAKIISFFKKQQPVNEAQSPEQQKSKQEEHMKELKLAVALYTGNGAYLQYGLHGKNGAKEFSQNDAKSISTIIYNQSLLREKDKNTYIKVQIWARIC